MCHSELCEAIAAFTIVVVLGAGPFVGEAIFNFVRSKCSKRNKYVKE